ncbi:MAG: NAD(P)/FAD-dependent oxidoreductase [Clostridiales bacterium]|nr:NAD(P)/FAD-dependent oxidoreductase [Clostridiales bacterium]
MREYVIIGNGSAAVGCIEGIRSRDTESHITVISEEKHHVYGRPLISYYLEGKTDLQRMKYRSDDFYEKNGCTVLYGKKAVRINNDSNTVSLDDGTEIKYDALCAATGSRPFVPPFKGLDTVEKKFSFMTLDDTLALERAVTPESDVLIVGAGLIGLKCAEGLSGRVCSITVCDLAERVLSSILDDPCAALMQKKLEENGIKFMLGDSADGFDRNIAHMKSGLDVKFDVLVLAVGVRPNTALISDIGGMVGRGITVDESMKTSLENIYAAGDCTECTDFSSMETKILAILPNAYMQGHGAGVNMAGGDERFTNAIPMNSIGFFGLHAMTAGAYYGEADGGEMYEEKTDGKIKRLFTKDGYLTGCIIIGDVERAGIYTSLIRERIPLDSIDFDALKKSPALIPFSEEYRGKKLGGVI